MGLAAWGLSVAISVFIACFDPFDLGTRSESAADATVQRLAAAFAPRPAASAITLVEVTRGTLGDARLRVQYPLSYGSQAVLVQAAAASGAAAILLDFEYLRDARDPEGMRALAQAVAAARTGGIPTFTGPIAPDRPDLDPLRAAAVPTGVWLDRAHPADYPVAGSAGARTAATDLFAAACRRDPARFSGCARPLGRGEAAIAVQFGGAFLAQDPAFIDRGDLAGCAGAGVLASVRSGLLGQAAAAPCPRYPTVPAQFVLAGADERVQRALRGHLVLIGAGPGLGDDKVVPGVGTVPGVALHAAALDNLLIWSRRHPAWPADFSPRVKVGPDELLKLSTILLLPALATAVATALGRAREAGEITPRCAAWAMVGVLAGLAGSLVGCAVLGWLLFDWPIAMALLVAAMSGLALGLASTEEVGAVLAPLNTRRAAWATVLTAAFALLALLWPGAAGWCAAFLAVIGAALWLRIRRAERLGPSQPRGGTT